MAKVIVLIIFLAQLCCMPIKISGQESPCPQYFTYVSDLTTNEVMGQVKISSVPKNTVLHLKVALSLAVTLPTVISSNF
jgi:hypothetical protein